MTCSLCLRWHHLIRYIVVKDVSIQPNEEKNYILFRIVVENDFGYLGIWPATSRFQLFAGIRHVISRYVPARISVFHRTLEVDDNRAPPASLILLPRKRGEVPPLRFDESLVSIRSIHLSDLLLVTQPLSPFAVFLASRIVARLQSGRKFRE